MMPANVLFWTTVLGILTVLGTAGVGIYTARSARAANRETLQLTGWKDLVTASRAEIKELRAQMEQDDKRHRQVERELTLRIDRLAIKMEASERRENALVQWARSVVRIMRDKNITFPSPPPGVENTDPKLFPWRKDTNDYQ